MRKKNISFEDNLKMAEEFLQKMTDSDITLSKSVEFYQNGMEQLEIAQKNLEEAKMKYEEIKKGKLF